MRTTIPSRFSPRGALAAVLQACVFALALGSAAATAQPDSATLFDRLGGMAGLGGIVDDTIERSSTDPATRRSFDGVNLKKLKQSIVEQLCALSGGPCKYSGDDMKTAHQGLGITEAEFYNLVQFLRDAIARAQVGEGPKNELLRILAPMKRDIVADGPAARPAARPEAQSAPAK